MPAGRPPIFETPEQMQSAIDSYFKFIEGEEWSKDEVEENPLRQDTMKRYPEHPTITGLILYIGFSHREALHDYEKKTEFSDIVKKARMKVENGYEKALFGKNAAGPIFALKNMGWTDKTEQVISGSLNTSGVDLSKLSDEALKQLRDAQSSISQ